MGVHHEILVLVHFHKQASTTADVQKAPEPMIQEASDKQKGLKSQRDAHDDDLTDIECDPPPKRPRLLTSQIQKGTTLDELHLERSASKRETLITHTTDAKGKSSVLPTVVSEKQSSLTTSLNAAFLPSSASSVERHKTQSLVLLSLSERQVKSPLRNFIGDLGKQQGEQWSISAF